MLGVVSSSRETTRDLPPQDWPNFFYRNGTVPLGILPRTQTTRLLGGDPGDYYIVLDPSPLTSNQVIEFRKHGLHVPDHEVFRLEQTKPTSWWDERDCMFLIPSLKKEDNILLVMAFSGILSGTTVDFVVLCDSNPGSWKLQRPRCKVFSLGAYPDQAQAIFQSRYTESLRWTDVRLQAPELMDITDTVEIASGNDLVRIVVSIRSKNYKKNPGSTDCLVIEIVRIQAKNQKQDKARSEPTLFRKR